MYGAVVDFRTADYPKDQKHEADRNGDISSEKKPGVNSGSRFAPGPDDHQSERHGHERREVQSFRSTGHGG